MSLRRQAQGDRHRDEQPHRRGNTARPRPAARSSAASRRDINLGVLLSGTTVTAVSSSLVLTISMLATGVRLQGGLAGYLVVAAVILLTALGMLAMTMVLLGRAAHPRIVGSVNGFLNIILFFPSGALYPIQSFPPWLRTFAQVNPEMHAMKAVLFRNGDLAAASGHVGFLGAFVVLRLTLSTLTMKRTL